MQKLSQGRMAEAMLEAFPVVPGDGSYEDYVLVSLSREREWPLTEQLLIRLTPAEARQLAVELTASAAACVGPLDPVGDPLADDPF